MATPAGYEATAGIESAGQSMPPAGTIQRMEPELEAAFDAIDQAVAWAQKQCESGSPTLSDEYLAHLDAVERMPGNQSGADKSWMWPAAVAARRRFASVRRG